MFYLFLLAHLVADFILQPLWLVQRKRRWDGLLLHGAIVLGCMLLLPLFEPATLELWPMMLAVTAIHMAADWWKVHYGDHLFKWSLGPFLLDQVIHVVTIGGLLSLLAPAAVVWEYGWSPFIIPAMYASVYIIAACAAPIGVIVWLDPNFEHTALAGQARIRALAASALVVSLTLMGGPLALPAILFGLALVAHRPVSAHPLDTPPGLMVVLGLAATLGAALTLLS